jgi:hypothetical protein
MILACRTDRHLRVFFFMRLVAPLALIILPAVASAQLRVSLGVGAGLSGSTDESLSYGRGAPIVMGQVTRPLFPGLGLGAEVDYWKGPVSHVAFATALLQAHIPLIPIYFKAGLGYGNGSPDGNGNVSGLAGQLGAMYDLTLPAVPVALTVFTNALLAHARLRSVQTVDAGLAITWK